MHSQRSNVFSLCALYSFLLVVFLQPANADVMESNNDLNHHTSYLNSIISELTEKPTATITLDVLTNVTIAIDKIHGWGGPLDAKTRKALDGKPGALRDMEALRLLLQQSPHGLQTLIQSSSLTSVELLRVSKMLHEHGYVFAGNAIGVLAPDLPGKRILYLASIPKDKRSAVEATLLTYVKDPPNRMMLARTALDMFLRPPAGLTIDPKDYYAIALHIGQGTSVVSFETAQQLAQGGKGTEAVQMVMQLTVAQPADAVLQLRAARFLRSLGNQAATVTLYQQALVTVPEPQRREVRLDYLEYLQWQKKNDEISTLQIGPDALLAGDAALVTARYDEAAKLYAPLVTEATNPLETRLAAWAGLLDADPGQAFPLGKTLLPALGQADAPSRATLVAWTGRQLWTALSREVPAKPGTFVMGWRKQYRPAHDVKGWETQAAASASQLLEIDAEACLRPDPGFTPDSFRYPAAMLFALAGEPQKATAILARSLEYQIPPPPGGWRIFDGTPTPDTDKPRTRTTPTVAETKKLTLLLLEELARCPHADERVPALSAVLADNLAHQIAAATTEADRRTHLQELASVVKYSVVALDPLPRPLRTDLPPPPVRQVEMARFAPIATTVQKALAQDAVAKHGLILVNEGLRDALLTASNPELLTALTELASVTIHRYAEASAQPQFATDERKRLAEYLKSRPVYDMTPYVARLTEEEK